MPEHEAFANVEVTGSLNGSAQPSDLDELSLSSFGARLKRIFLPGGQILFRENEVADSLYIVISGCLGVVVRRSDGRDVLVARIPAGETVGEMGFLDGGTRSATVEALRDTELLKFDKVNYQDRLLRDPRSMHALISLLVRRLRKATHPENRTTLPSRTVAVVPLALDVDHRRVEKVGFLLFRLDDRGLVQAPGLIVLCREHEPSSVRAEGNISFLCLGICNPLGLTLVDGSNVDIAPDDEGKLLPVGTERHLGDVVGSVLWYAVRPAADGGARRRRDRQHGVDFGTVRRLWRRRLQCGQSRSGQFDAFRRD